MPIGLSGTPTAAPRTASFEQRLAIGLFALLAMVPPLSPVLGGGYALVLGERVMIFAIAALSLELLVGAAGLLSFGHAAFLGIGAYAAGIAASHGLGTLSIALPAALASSALFALATGAIAVRTRGVYFIMITLAFAQMAFFVATSLAPYGGDDGLSWPTRTLVLGTRILKNELVFFYLVGILLIASYLSISRLIASRFGRVLRGLKDNETRMQAMGFTPYAYRLTAYVIAGAFCGLAGFLLGNQAEFVSPAYMHWQRSGELIMMVLLGGTGRLWGAMFGALAYLLLEETLSRLTEHWKVVFGPTLVLMVLFARGGIAGAFDALRQGLPARRGAGDGRRSELGAASKACGAASPTRQRLLACLMLRSQCVAGLARACGQAMTSALGRRRHWLAHLAARNGKSRLLRWWWRC